jgi:hypothetical protein
MAFGYFSDFACLAEEPSLTPNQTALEASEPAEGKAKENLETNPASIPNIAVKNRPLTSKTSVYQATYGDSETLEIEMLQWSDGAYSLPIKAIGQLFGFSGQYDANTKLMKLINP